ncbi:MAG: PQQ-binding-like beta-propeller repeat protein [Bacteroidales bacterium]|nr:PQQ-binding-like beta-propeller repeat protein [Bacteroidales bacterium]
MKTLSNYRPRLLSIAAVFFLFINSILAGDPVFKELNRVKLPFEPSEKVYEHTQDFRFFLCSTKSDMLMFDGIEGKILWQKNFEKDFGNKKFSNQFWNQDANVILVFDEDTRKGIAVKYFIDGKTGKLLWQSDKYVSDYGQYELSYGFENFFDLSSKGVLLPTKESVDLVEVNTGKQIWSRKFELSGKAKEFDCMILAYYNLVKITTGKETAIYLTTTDGKEVTDIEPYFDLKKYLSDRKFATILPIKDKNMYVIMQGETNRKLSFLGSLGGVSTDIPKFLMKFIAYEEGTNKKLWQKEYKISFVWDWITDKPYYKLYYSSGKIFVEHAPFLKANDGLTVLDVMTGNKLWECYYSTYEMDSKLTKSIVTPFPAPDPLIYENAAYVVDKTKNKVSAYNAESGSLIWESEKYPDAKKIPTLIAASGNIIMGYGGDALIVTKTTQTGSGFCYNMHTENKRVECYGKSMDIYKRGYNNSDKYGIIAYDAKTGKIAWDSESISKKAKDKFSFIAGMSLVEGKLFCATDKNFFILDPKTGDVLSSIPVSKEGMGDTWKMYYFPEKQEIILNCDNGVIKIDAIGSKVKGTVKIKNIPYYPATYEMNVGPESLYSDYAIIIDGNPEKLKFDRFASIDLDKMVVRGSEDAGILFDDYPHFSTNAEMYFKSDGKDVVIFKIK